MRIALTLMYVDYPVATTAWGATLLSKMAANPDEEPFSAVHEWDLTSFLLGLTSA